jgi:hypothetical protein
MIRRSLSLVFLLAAAAALSPVARAQAVLKVDENVSFRFGAAIQMWADWTQDPATRGYSQNLFIRRASFYVGGQVAPNVTFFIRTDSPNLGKAPKESSFTFFLEDAYAEWGVANEFILDGGLILVPFCRNCLEYSVRLLTLDFGSYSFLSNGVTQSSVARDSGFQAKGYLLGDHLEYRIGAFQGHREPLSRNSFRSAGRLQYNFFGTEKVPFYPGTYLGTKKILAVGAAFDLQADYKAFAADAFLDLPVGGGDGVTAQIDLLRWDGGTTFPTLQRQNDFFFEGGYYVSSAKLLPWVRFESQRYSARVNEVRNQKRFQVGMTWYAFGHNANVRAAFGKIIPSAAGLPLTNQFTVQMQLFYY